MKIKMFLSTKNSMGTQSSCPGFGELVEYSWGEGVKNIVRRILAAIFKLP